MDKLIMDMMKEGKDVNEILNMPYHFVLELFKERNNSKEVKSLASAFGG